MFLRIKVYLHITVPYPYCPFRVRPLKFVYLLYNGHVYTCPFRIRTVRVRILKFVGDNVFGDFTDTDIENTELCKQSSVTTDNLIGFHTYSREVFVKLKNNILKFKFLKSCFFKNLYTYIKIMCTNIDEKIIELVRSYIELYDLLHPKYMDSAQKDTRYVKLTLGQ